jgi:hypothetical protein
MCSRSARSSQAWAGSISASSEPATCELCGSASRTRSASGSSPSIGPGSLATRTCAPLWATPTAHPRTHTPRRVDHGQQLANQVFGLTCPCRCHTSWRTSQLSLLEEWSVFSGTWPRAGMTRSGTAYPLRPLAPLTAATGSGLWPTPSKSDPEGSRTLPEGTTATGQRPDGKKAQVGLPNAVKMWRTPQSGEGNGGGQTPGSASHCPPIRGSGPGGRPTGAANGGRPLKAHQPAHERPKGWTEVE